MKDTSYNSSFISYDDDANWLITYADLMTILLVFFVLLYSLAFFEKEKYEERVKVIMRQLKQDHESKGGMELFDLSADMNRKISLEDITGLRSRETALFKTANQFVRKTGKRENITSQFMDGKIILTVSGETLFSSGSASLNQGSLHIFNQMIQIFDEFPEFIINIKGHTDNIPISTQAFPSNWELSAIRATTVLKYLISKGISPKRLTATGYGDIMPRVPNTTDKNRDRNRRVEFVLEKNETNN
ncbi:MAG: OmpA family protein [Desulfobacteraceae bacterium]|nr:OmpA family protein [Desulfobacteraceae bacterium]